MPNPQKSSRSSRASRNRTESPASRSSKGRVEEPRRPTESRQQFDPNALGSRAPNADHAVGGTTAHHPTTPLAPTAQPGPTGSEPAQSHAKPQRPIASFAELVIAVVGGSGLDIISLLTHTPLYSGVIATRVGLKAPGASKELHSLLRHDLVECDRIGIHSLYRLTGRLRTFRRSGMLQIGVDCPAGHWAHFNIDESFGRYPAVPPPDHFIG